MQFAVLTVGDILGLIASLQNSRQWRLENALRLVSLFHENFDSEDMAHWESLFIATSDPAGAQTGYYMAANHTLQPLSDYFEEGSSDNHTVARMAGNLEVICYEILRTTVDVRMVWYDLGQILKTMHDWLGQISGRTEGSSILSESFPSIDRVWQKHSRSFERWPRRIQTYLE